jgi:hypothetical protein
VFAAQSGVALLMAFIGAGIVVVVGAAVCGAILSLTTDGDLEEATWLAFLSTHTGPPKWRSKHTPMLSRR